jgi:hypothetical protein
MKKLQILGIIRHALTFGGGILVAKGILNEGMAVELAGALVTLIGGVWSAISPEKRAL